MSALDQAFIKAFEKKTGSTATPETPPAPLMPSAGPTPIAPSPRKRRVLPPAPPRDNPIDEGYADGAWYRLDHPAEDNQRNPAAHESPSEPTSSLPPIEPPAAHASAPVAPQAPLPTVPVGDPSNVEPATAPSDLATNVAEANYVASALKLPPIHQSIPSPPTGPPTGPPTAPAAKQTTEQPTQPVASPMPAALTDEEIAQLLAVDATPMVCLPDYDPAALANLPMMVEATLPEYELPEQALPATDSSKPEASKPESSKAAPAAAKMAPDSAEAESDESAGDAELDAGASSVVKKRLSKKAKAAREQRRAAAEARRQAREAKSREASQHPAKSGEVKSDEAKPRNAEQPASSGNDDRDVVRLSDETPITISLEKLRLAIANSIASTQPAGVQPQTPATQSSEASQPAAKSATPIVVEVPTAVSTTTPVIESPTSVAVKPAEVIDKPTLPEATQTQTNSPATDASPVPKPEAGVSEATDTAPAAAPKPEATIETKIETTIEPPAPSIAMPQTAAKPQTDAAPKSTPLAKAEAAPSTPPAPKSQTAAKPEATVKSPPSSKPKAAPKPRVFFQPEWEVDRFAWPETCEALYRDQQQYFSDAGRRLKAASGDGLNVLAITSPRRGDGKTTLALCLARCAVEAGVRVALVDADFAYPQLQSLLGINETCSWHESFQTALPLAECAIVSRDDELVIFPLAQSARAVNVHATRDAIAAEIQRIAGQFELVIVDLGSMDADAADLCDAAATNPTNAVILVRDLRNEDDAEIDDAVARIQAAGISAVGIAENFGSRQPKA